MIARLVASRWFALAELGGAIGGAILVSLQPGGGWLSGWPLVLALAPAGLRWRAGRPLFQRTPFDLPLILFLLTAAVGVWAAYDHTLAWNKFWMLVSAAWVYYALAGQPPVNRRLVTHGLSLTGGVLALGYLLIHDWHALPTGFSLLDQVGERWMALRLTLPGALLADPHMLAGLLTMLLPFAVAWAVSDWRERRRRAGWAGLAALAMAAALVLSGRRTAWISLPVATGLWLIWRWSGARVHYFAARHARAIEVGLIGLGGAALLVLPWLSRLIVIADVPGRLANYLPALTLTGDFLILGGGLASFSGLYSRYALVIPWLYIPQSYNVLLNVMMEQGFLGALALLVLWLGGAGRSYLDSRTFANDAEVPLRMAAGIAWAAVVCYSFAEDPFYVGFGTAFLFALNGISVMLLPPQPALGEARPPWLRLIPHEAGRYQAGLVAALVLVVSLWIGYRPLLADVYANLGSVLMAQVELAGWPATRPDEGKDLTALVPAEDLLIQALALSPHNHAAALRLGLLAENRGDFAHAVALLETAAESGFASRGLRKTLGYNYVWLGDVEKAAPWLVGISEAYDEMGVYSWWWGTQGRADLARNAARMQTWLEAHP